jgi:hypothetical protein
MATSRTLTIRYPDGATVREMKVDKTDVCNMSGLIANMLESTSTDVVDFSEGQNLLPVDRSVITFLARECDYGTSINSLSDFIKNLETFHPTPRAWQVLDCRLTTILGNLLRDKTNWVSDVSSYSAIDTVLDFLNEIAPYMERLPDMKSTAHTLLSGKVNYVYFSFKAHPVVKEILRDIAFEKFYIGSAITPREQPYSNVSTTPELYCIVYGGSGCIYTRISERKYD